MRYDQLCCARQAVQAAHRVPGMDTMAGRHGRFRRRYFGGGLVGATTGAPSLSVMKSR
ncbi:hypothetical protein SXANM310S_03650 [Streptomyces xanthochromogenes]